MSNTEAKGIKSILGYPPDARLLHVTIAAPQVPAEEWDAYYTRIIENLQPGVTEIIIHVALDDAEMRAVTIDHPDYGAAWRQRDLDVFTSDAIKQLLERHNIHLITWRKIGQLLQK